MNVDELIALESSVWEALRRGDSTADNELLAADFLGVYPTGFADRADHVEQLVDGPTVLEFAIHDAQMLEVSTSHVLLAYRAEYRRPGNKEAALEEMYVSSLWSNRDGSWVNVFSQDTPVDPTATLP